MKNKLLYQFIAVWFLILTLLCAQIALAQGTARREALTLIPCLPHVSL